MAKRASRGSARHSAARFATTHWSAVMAAGRPSSEGYEEVLETLVETYWFPLYAYLRRHGSNRDEAADFTQAFFAKMMEEQYLKGVMCRAAPAIGLVLTIAAICLKSAY